VVIPTPRTEAVPRLLVHPFPTPGPRVRLAYRELHLAAHGTAEQKREIGHPAVLPRPWEPATCPDPELRLQLWSWLEVVVVWLNREYTWDVATLVPACWPNHPHLVHEVAVLADQRRRAGLALTSDALEEWHRYCLPAFVDRMLHRTRSHCEEGHQPWPARSRHSQHTSPAEAQARDDLYARDLDVASTGSLPRPASPPAPPRLGLVDLDTGEIHQPDDP
jgi:hypothetical protein